MLYRIISTLSLLILLGNIVSAGDWDRILNLRGRWKFSIGDDMKWASTSVNEKDWEDIRVPSPWEDEGFHGYDGYAWYRRHFKCTEDFRNKYIYLHMGYIDDVDQVYINGKLIGATGSFPPNYETAYNAYRAYPVPANILNFNADNVIAVRVYDSQMQGGIVSGNIGFYALENALIADYNLEGLWKFKTGSEDSWKDKNYNDKNWDQINVPGYWEDHGYKNYDGFAWYRKEFYLPANYKDEKYVMMVGRIDDLDKTYINGKLIGSTGDMKNDPDEIQFSQEYSAFRGYFIPDGVLVPGKNVVAVKVYDGYNIGGIYQGPVGLITQNKYTNYWKHNRKKPSKDLWDIFFGNNNN